MYEINIDEIGLTIIQDSLIHAQRHARTHTYTHTRSQGEREGVIESMRDRREERERERILVYQSVLIGRQSNMTGCVISAYHRDNRCISCLHHHLSWISIRFTERMRRPQKKRLDISRSLSRQPVQNKRFQGRQGVNSSQMMTDRKAFPLTILHLFFLKKDNIFFKKQSPFRKLAIIVLHNYGTL